MIKTTSKTNTNPPDGEYPYGQIRDRDGITAGTPGNLEVYGDMHQFFEKVIRESTLTPNDLPDNEYNGYQLWDAMAEHCKNLRNYSRYYVKISQGLTNPPSVDQELENDLGTPSISYISTGRYRFEFAAGTFPTANKVALFSSDIIFGFMDITISTDARLDVDTYDTAGSLTNNLLSGTDMFIRVYD